MRGDGGNRQAREVGRAAARAGNTKATIPQECSPGNSRRVGLAVRDQIGGCRVESHKASILSDRGPSARPIRFDAIGTDGKTSRCGRAASRSTHASIAQKDIGHAIGIARDQIARVGGKGYEPAAGADRGRAAGAIGVAAIEAHRHQSGRGRTACRRALTGVAQIDFVQAGSAGGEIGRWGHERGVTGVPRARERPSGVRGERRRLRGH